MMTVVGSLLASHTLLSMPIVALPDIVVAFLAGLAINEAVLGMPAVEKLEFVGKAFFIPIFFAVTGFLIDPIVFARSIVDNFAVVAAILLALIVGRWLAAEGAGRAFRYSTAARRTMWSLTLPQVAATLATPLVAFKTFDRTGERLLDARMLNAVLVMVLTTSIPGPLMTQYFAPRILEMNDIGAPGASSVHP